MRLPFRALAVTMFSMVAIALAGCGTRRGEPESRPVEKAETKYTNPGPTAPEAPLMPAPEPHLPATTKYVPDKADEPRMEPPSPK